MIAALGHWLRMDPTNGNWWHIEICVPKQVGELLILRDQAITLMSRSRMTKMTGQNLVWTAEILIRRRSPATSAFRQ